MYYLYPLQCLSKKFLETNQILKPPCQSSTKHLNNVSNFSQSIFTIAFCIIPGLLFILSLIPVAALNGLLLFMGLQAFGNNAFTARLYSLCFYEQEVCKKSPFSPQNVDLKNTRIFVFSQFIMLLVTFGITISPLAILFPVGIYYSIAEDGIGKNY